MEEEAIEATKRKILALLDGVSPALSRAVPATIVQDSVTREHSERLDKVLRVELGRS